jgi:uncharacterized protein (DUF433 family)
MPVSFGTIPRAIRRVQGGTLRVGNSRVSLDSVVYAFNRGEGAAEIQDAFDTLSLAEIHAAIAYYLHNKEKVDKYLAKRELEFEKARAKSHDANKKLIDKIQARKNGIDPDWNK